MREYRENLTWLKTSKINFSIIQVGSASIYAGVSQVE